jgi:branched-chain amino acid transport system permease protein
VAAIGAVPAGLGAMLVSIRGWSYWIGLVIAVVGGILLGGLVDVLIIRRFAKAPRLILTVATLGIAQILAFITVYLPIWLGSEEGIANKLITPWTEMRVNNAQGALFFDGDYVFAIALLVVFAAGLAAFFRYTRLGIALRAAAENADRASLLGIPVRRVGTAAWMIAGLFGAVTIFARSSLVGIPTNGTLGYQVLLFALAPAVLARMESIPVAVLGGFAVGLIEQVSVSKTGSNDLCVAIMLAFILGALLAQRGKLSRAQDSGVSTWQTLQEFRPVPRELRRLPEVVGARAGMIGLLVVLALMAPELVSKGEVAKLAALPIAGIVAASLVILTGWAGQISLGQYALVGAGGVAAANLASHHPSGFLGDFWVTVIVGAVVGAVVAICIGLPAVRIQGLFLAVTTLSLAGAVENYFFKRGTNKDFANAVVPDAATHRLSRPWLWERIDLSSDRTYYFVCLVFLVVAMLAATSFRRHRSGRVLIAVRENQRAAPSYSINLVRTRLAAFAVSGAIAGVAGVLLAYQQLTIDASTYGVLPSVSIFVATVMGGLTSLPGAVFGAIAITAVSLFGDPRVDGISLFVTGPGLLLILLFLPGGFAEAGYRMRDSFLRFVANRRGIDVPSLVADRRIDDEVSQDDVIEAAEHRQEELEELRPLVGGAPA